MVKEKLANEAYFLFNSPYSPSINPIEEAFSQLKSTIKKQRPKTEKELVESTFLAMSKFTTRNMRNYIKHVLTFIPRCLLEEDI